LDNDRGRDVLDSLPRKLKKHIVRASQHAFLLKSPGSEDQEAKNLCYTHSRRFLAVALRAAPNHWLQRSANDKVRKLNRGRAAVEQEI
jgi:hypothetical protein